MTAGVGIESLRESSVDLLTRLVKLLRGMKNVVDALVDLTDKITGLEVGHNLSGLHRNLVQICSRLASVGHRGFEVVCYLLIVE